MSAIEIRNITHAYLNNSSNDRFNNLNNKESFGLISVLQVSTTIHLIQM